MSVELSIAIVAYHNYEDIKKALESIELHTDNGLKKRIYIVDNSHPDYDNSITDNFKEFISKYDDIEYTDTGDNIGFGKGHNYVLANLESRYHAIVNPDILLTEDVFAKIIQYMDTNEDVGMCIPRIVNEQGELQQVYRKYPTVFDMFIRMFCKKLFPKRAADHTLQNMDYSQPFQVPFGQGSFLVIRTELFKKLNGFDDGFFMYLEDADLCKRVNQVSKLMYFPYASVIHKWEQGSHKNKVLFKHHINSMIYYFKKWGIKLF